MDQKLIEVGLSVFLFNGAGLMLLGYLAKRSLDGLDDRLDDLAEKIERLIEGRIDFVVRSDCRESVARLHRKIDIIEANNMELRNRISLLEGKLSPPLLTPPLGTVSKEGK